MVFGAKKQVVRVEANLLWLVAQNAETGEFFGVCPPLNVSAAGDTFAEFHECATEVMGLLFADLYQAGELTQFLQENGWQLMGPGPEPGRTPTFDVPYELSRRPMEELLQATA